jgi:transposase-like protein
MREGVQRLDAMEALFGLDRLTEALRHATISDRLCRVAGAGEQSGREFILTWRKLPPKVAVNLEEAGEDLLTFYRFPRSQWKSLGTTNARLNMEFRRRVKIQNSPPAAELLLGQQLS